MTLRRDVQSFVERLKRRGEAKSLQEKREAFAFLSSFAESPSANANSRFSDDEFHSRDGSLLRSRIYNLSEAKRRVVFYFHGGGYVCGSLYSHHEGLLSLSENVNACFIHVDYRLAPEFKFPTAFNDAVDALRHYVSRFAPDSIFVMGDSAGGNLAAALSFHFRDQVTPERIEIARQVLLYPTLDATFAEASWREVEEQSIANPKVSGEFNDLYARSPDDLRDSAFSPLLAGNFAKLPPCHAYAGSQDGASGDTKAYVEKLRKAGVAAEYREFPEMIHGFFNMTSLFEEARSLHTELRALLTSDEL